MSRQCLSIVVSCDLILASWFVGSFDQVAVLEEDAGTDEGARWGTLTEPEIAAPRRRGRCDDQGLQGDATSRECPVATET